MILLDNMGPELLEKAVNINEAQGDRKVVLEAPEAVAGELVSGQFVAGDVDNFVAGGNAEEE